MRKCVGLVRAALLASAALVTLATAAMAAGNTASSAASATSPASESDHAALVQELRAMRVQMQQMQQRIDALEARVDGGHGANRASVSASVPATTTVAGAANKTAVSGTGGSSAGATAATAPPPGVTPAGVPLPPSTPPPGVTVGSALKSLMPGPVTAPQAPQYGQLRAGGAPEAGSGVIIPSIQGVPKVFIPDIGAVGDLTFQQSDFHRGDPRYDPAADKFLARDTQIILFSPIDPYTNAQISIDKPYNGPFDIEEAYAVFNKLPYNLSLRAGQFRPMFGLINNVDTFQLPMVNRPNAIANFIGDDGFVEPGVNLTGYIPNPWEADIKADIDMLSGVNTRAFNYRNGDNFDFAYMGTVRYSRDLMQSGFLNAGFSMAGGPGPGGQNYLEDPFLQLQYAPDQRHIWTWDLEGMLDEAEGVGNHGVKRGFYTLLDYNFWLRWHAAALLDVADRPDVASGTTVGLSPILTYFVSDNTRLRLQYTHTTPSGPERAADQFFMQATFSLGNLKPLD